MTTKTNTINWKAAAAVAEGLGIHTRLLVEDHEADHAREWALRLAGECNASPYSAPRAASYLELAVLLGHSKPPPARTPADDERLSWLQRHLESMEGNLKTLRDTVAGIVAEQDQAKAADTEKAKEASDAA